MKKSSVITVITAALAAFTLVVGGVVPSAHKSGAAETPTITIDCDGYSIDIHDPGDNTRHAVTAGGFTTTVPFEAGTFSANWAENWGVDVLEYDTLEVEVFGPYGYASFDATTCRQSSTTTVAPTTTESSTSTQAPATTQAPQSSSTEPVELPTTQKPATTQAPSATLPAQAGAAPPVRRVQPTYTG